MAAKVPCMVCSADLQVKPANGRKSGKPFLMVVCPVDGRHFRGFIGDREYVDRVVERSQEQNDGE